MESQKRIQKMNGFYSNEGSKLALIWDNGPTRNEQSARKWAENEGMFGEGPALEGKRAGSADQYWPPGAAPSS